MYSCYVHENHSEAWALYEDWSRWLNDDKLLSWDFISANTVSGDQFLYSRVLIKSHSSCKPCAPPNQFFYPKLTLKRLQWCLKEGVYVRERREQFCTISLLGGHICSQSSPHFLFTTGNALVPSAVDSSGKQISYYDSLTVGTVVCSGMSYSSIHTLNC